MDEDHPPGAVHAFVAAPLGLMALSLPPQLLLIAAAAALLVTAIRRVA